MLQDVIDRVNRIRKQSQNSQQFKESAEQHAAAIQSEESTQPIIKRKRRKAKQKSFAAVYRPYFNSEIPH